MAGARVIAAIPARLGSVRLARKPLLPIGGQPMVAHVVRAARAARLVDRVVVATDDAEIAAAARLAGAEAVLTARELPSGTDRVAAALRALPAASAGDVVVNVQGDEPCIAPSAIDLAVEALLTRPEADMSTLSAPLQLRDLLDPSKVKVVCARGATPRQRGPAAVERALFFSRSAIGVDRELLERMLKPRFSESSSEDDILSAMPRTNGPSHVCRLHVGVYAFRYAALQQFVALPPSPLELVERLEQMRAVEAGMCIVVAEVTRHSRGVDTQEDLDAIRRELERPGST